MGFGDFLTVGSEGDQTFTIGDIGRGLGTAVDATIDFLTPGFYGPGYDIADLGVDVWGIAKGAWKGPDDDMSKDEYETSLAALDEKMFSDDPVANVLEKNAAKRELKAEFRSQKENVSIHPGDWGFDQWGKVAGLGLTIWNQQEKKKANKKILERQSGAGKAREDVAEHRERTRLMNEAGFDYYGRPLGSGGGGGGGGGGGVTTNTARNAFA